MSAQKPTRSAKSDNPDLSTTTQADLDELRRYLRSAPSKREILVTSLSALLTAIFATIATIIAIYACLRG